MSAVNSSDKSPFLDIRPAPDFERVHASAAVHIALEELAGRMHELPPKGTLVQVYDPDPDRYAAAAELLEARGYLVETLAADPSAFASSGPATARLWQPSPFLVEALDLISPSGKIPLRAADCGCGAGREAVFLALRGYKVDAIDRLPDALSRAADLADRNGVTINTITADLRKNPVLEPDTYNLVCGFRFFEPALFPAVVQALRPGGHAVWEAFHNRDPRTDKGCRDSTLTRLLEGLEIVMARDGVERGGRVFSQAAAWKIR